MRIRVVLDPFDGLLQQITGVLSQLDRLVRMTVADQVREQLQHAVHAEDVGGRLVPLDVLVHPDCPVQPLPPDRRTIRARRRNLRPSQQVTVKLGFPGWFPIPVYHDKHRDFRTAIPNVFVEFGAATRDGAQLAMTPLGRWAWREMHARMPRPISADLPVGGLLTRVVDNDENGAWQAARPWLIGRDPLLAAREILAARRMPPPRDPRRAADATPARRIAVVEIVDALGEPAHDVWRDACGARSRRAPPPVAPWVFASGRRPGVRGEWCCQSASGESCFPTLELGKITAWVCRPSCMPKNE